MIKRTRNIILLLFALISFNANATHNRAGEITYRLLSGYTFEVTITTYTYVLSTANRDELTIDWGDNTSDILKICSEAKCKRDTLPDYYLRNIYIGKHTFPGPGTYTLLMEDPNRNEGIKNIPNSVYTVFAIKTILVINPIIGKNSAPLLSNPPIDKAAVGVTFIHNPGAYDSDGDSLSYKLTVCEEEGGVSIPNYKLPPASRSITVNPITGDFIWDAPTEVGKYNVAILVEEWRNGIKISSIIRDMQIDVIETTNTPPINPKLPDLCVVAGDTISFDFTVIDTNTFKGAYTDYINTIALGVTFDIKTDPNAKLSILSKVKGITKAHFLWITDCSKIRKQPWNVLIRSKDSLSAAKNNTLSLVDIDNFNIKVMGPSPVLKKVDPLNNSVAMTWNKYTCSNALGMFIYRRQDKFNYTIDSCTEGINKESGFELVGKTTTIDDTSFVDSNNGNGLFQGAEYCYLLVAYFQDGSQSLPSNEVCVTLKPGLPAIVNVSVITKDATRGVIYVAWAKPKVDTIPGISGPYTFKIYRSDLNLFGNAATLIKTKTTSDLNDTTFYDTLNTVQFPYSYKIELYDGNNVKIGDKQETASSLYPSLSADNHRLILTMIKNTPWSNSRYIVARYNKATSAYDSIGFTETNSYIDSNLINGVEYCYRIKSIGKRKLDSINIPSVNYSHINCGIAMDTVPPCQPFVRVIDSCDAFFTTLIWSHQVCAYDAVMYNIYYSPNLNAQPSIIATINNPYDTLYIYHPSNVSNLKGCFYVTAVDSSGNESRVSSRVCSDQCFEYSLPNVFTPNGDGINDFFTPMHQPLVNKIDIKIYNRWGVQVFETTEPTINWNGRYQKNDQPLPDGTYYYICTVYEDRLSGENIRTLYGFVQILHSSIDNRPAKE